MRQGGSRPVVLLILGCLCAMPGCASVGDHGPGAARGVAQGTFRIARATGRAAYQAGKSGTTAVARRVTRAREASETPENLLVERDDPEPRPDRPLADSEADERGQAERPGGIILADHRQPRPTPKLSGGKAIRHNLPSLDLDEVLATAGNRAASAWR